MSDRFLSRRKNGSQIVTIPGYARRMEKLTSVIPFIPARGYARLAAPGNYDPPFFHMLGSTCSCLTCRDTAIELIPRGVLIRVGNDLDGHHVVVWKHREILSSPSRTKVGRYVDVILLRHSDSENTIIIPQKRDLESTALRAISLAESYWSR